MHFCYLDEAGCTGAKLDDKNQPIFVLGGICVDDGKWNGLRLEFDKIIDSYFDNKKPQGFELHASKLLSPNGEGVFEGHSDEKRLALASDILDLASSQHHVHYIAISKEKLKESTAEPPEDFFIDLNHPYCLGYNYMITYIEKFIRSGLGRTASAMIIVDEKKECESYISKITDYRRYAVPKIHRVKKITEFTHSIDSRKNQMVQISDLLVFCIKKFFTMETSTSCQWPDEIKNFYANSFDKIYSRVRYKGFIKREGRNTEWVNSLTEDARLTPQRNWKSKYNI